MGIKSDITKLLTRSNKVTRVKVLSKLSIIPQAQGLEKQQGSLHLLPRGTYHLARAEKIHSKQPDSKQVMGSPLRARSHLSAFA